MDFVEETVIYSNQLLDLLCTMDNNGDCIDDQILDLPTPGQRQLAHSMEPATPNRRSDKQCRLSMEDGGVSVRLEPLDLLTTAQQPEMKKAADDLPADTTSQMVTISTITIHQRLLCSWSRIYTNQ